MTLFNVTAWCDRAFFTSFEVEADSPEQALTLAKARAENEPADECDSNYPWDTFQICDANDNSLLTFQDDQAKLIEADSKLLAALKLCHEQLSLWVADTETSDLSPEDDEALRKAADAIAEAESLTTEAV
jgi:hypothetical protein